MKDPSDSNAASEARPSRRGGVTFEVDTGYGKLFVTINSWAPDGSPQEIFGAMSKANPETAVQLAALCRLASRALQAGLPPSEIIASWRGLTGASAIWSTVQSPILPPGEGPDASGNLVTRQIRSLPDALAVVLELYERERAWLKKEGEGLFRVTGVDPVPDDEVLDTDGREAAPTAGRLRSLGYEILRRRPDEPSSEGEGPGAAGGEGA